MIELNITNIILECIKKGGLSEVLNLAILNKQKVYELYTSLVLFIFCIHMYLPELATCHLQQEGLDPLHPVPSVWHVLVESPFNVKPTVHVYVAVIPLATTAPLVGLFGWSHAVHRK